MAGLALQHLAVVRGRLGLGAEAALRRSQHQPRREMVRIDIERTMQRGDRSGRPALQLEHPAQVEPRRREVGRQFAGPLQRRQGCLVLALGLQRNAQTDVRQGIARILRQRAAQDRHRLRVVAAQLLQLARQAQRFHAIGRERQHRGQRRLGASQFTVGHRTAGLVEQAHRLRRQTRGTVPQQRMNLACPHRRIPDCPCYSLPAYARGSASGSAAPVSRTACESCSRARKRTHPAHRRESERAAANPGDEMAAAFVIILRSSRNR